MVGLTLSFDKMADGTQKEKGWDAVSDTSQVASSSESDFDLLVTFMKLLHYIFNMLSGSMGDYKRGFGQLALLTTYML
jgi:hypothetical protein